MKDTWRISNRLTANLGLRFDRQHAFLPKQIKEASPDFPTLFPAATYAPFGVLTWYSTVPRLGLAWDLANKTVVKTTFGRYSNGMPDGFANAYNPNANVTMTYRWRDLDRNGDYTPGEVNLDPNGLDFLSISGASSTQLNEDLQQPMTTEATASFERELRPNLGIRALYVFKSITDQYDTTNVARPRSAYNVPLKRRDPGPDGILDTGDDEGIVTIWDYDPAYRGAAFVKNELQNSPRDDHYQTIEFTLTKRASGRWSAVASFWAIKYHSWLTRLPDNPNNDLNALDEAWRWAGNMSGSYRMPWGVQFGAFVQSKIGLLSQRTNVFRAVDPDGGPRLTQLSTVMLRLEPFGSRKASAINVVNLRASKAFSLRRGERVELDFDLFNLLNSSAPITMTVASGPTFGYATAVLPPRVARVGVRYSYRYNGRDLRLTDVYGDLIPQIVNT